MGNIIRKIVEAGWKTTRKVNDVDISNPLTQDTISFMVDVVKEIIKPF
ncbi:hypothetical protein [Geobacillus thermoleovorans]